MALHSDELLKVMAAQSARLDPLPTEMSPRLKQLEGIRGLVFDIYGTLFVSGSGDISLAEVVDRNAILLSVLEESGVRWKDVNVRVGDTLINLIRASHAKDRSDGIDFPEVEIREIWRELLRSAECQGGVADEMIEVLAVRYETRVNPVWPMPGLAELFERLRSMELQLGIISNAQFYTPLLFEHFLGKSPSEVGFDDSLCVWSYLERRGKPSSALFADSVVKLAAAGIRPEEVLYVGNDMRNDIVPAAAVGMRTALFAGDARSLRLREHLADAIPADLILTHLDQLTQCLG
ncbi:MAG: putative hydrolase of the HAD superfamily [Verrucomicrobiales bacterium]|jgi:putative hydrolase of the HAD superfamily